MNKTEETRKRLLRKFKSLQKKATNRNDEIVLTIDGVETSNTYPMYAATEIDSKSPSDWIGDIIFFDYVLKNKEIPNLDFVFKPSC